MPISNYFFSPRFRAVDDDATTDTQALTSALEAQLSCSHAWLHANAGGRVCSPRVPGGLAASGYNNTYHVAAHWASLHAQPFLVTRGLRSIRVSMVGTVEGVNIETRLELQGFRSQDTVWVIGGSSTANVLRQTLLVLDSPADVEYETDLILWGKSQIVATIVSSLQSAQIDNGIVQVNAAALSNTGQRTLAALAPYWDSTAGGGFPVTVVHESLFRNNTAVGAGGGTVGAAALDERRGGTTFMGEIEIGRITNRAFTVEAFYE